MKIVGVWPSSCFHSTDTSLGYFLLYYELTHYSQQGLKYCDLSKPLPSLGRLLRCHKLNWSVALVLYLLIIMTDILLVIKSIFILLQITSFHTAGFYPLLICMYDL